MRMISLAKMVLGFILIATCHEMKSTSFTLQRTNTKRKQLALDTDADLDQTFELGKTELSSKLIKKLNSNIEQLEDTDTTATELDLESMEEYDNAEDMTLKRNARTYSIRQLQKIKANRNRPLTVHAILTRPTNVMRAYLRSKTGRFLRMDENGELSGAKNMKDKYVVFIIERMSKDAVRLKGEAAQKYICINKNRRIVTREKPMSKCLLRNYLEENHYQLFWSYLYSRKRDGESGWFLALRRNGKIRKPNKTKLGDKQTMFYVHRVEDEA